MNKILVIAPAHDQLDKRVNSSLEVMSELFSEVTIVYETRFALKELNQLDSVKYLFVDHTEPRLKVLPKVKVYLDFIDGFIEDDSLVYIHEPGVVGLLIAKGIKYRFNNIKIIFDYHDYVPWEVFYQVGKLTKNVFFRRVISRSILGFLSNYLSKQNIFDGLVGISKGQVKSLLKFLSRNESLPTLDLPNTRIKIDINNPCLTNQCDKVTLIWVGNIVDGRDLDDTIKYLDRLVKQYHMEFSFKIIGKVISSKLFDELKSKDYFIYCGEFKNDQDILNNLGEDINIGLFLGWKDEFNIGINEIGSPNKVYSYINVGIPVVYYHKLFDLKTIIGDNTGIGVSSFDQFKQALNEIIYNYSSFKNEVIKQREYLTWDNDNRIKLKKYLKNFINFYS